MADNHEFLLRTVTVGNGGWAAYVELCGADDSERPLLAQALKGLYVTRMSADSPFYVLRYEGVRYVFVTKRSRGEHHPPHFGNFYLVNVHR